MIIGVQDFGKRLERDIKKSVDGRLKITEELTGQTVNIKRLLNKTSKNLEPRGLKFHDSKNLKLPIYK